MTTNTIKETVELVCKICKCNADLKARELKRVKRKFGKDPMTYVYECPNCGRVIYTGYKELIDSNPNILFTLYNTGENPWDNN